MKLNKNRHFRYESIHLRKKNRFIYIVWSIRDNQSFQYNRFDPYLNITQFRKRKLCFFLFELYKLEALLMFNEREGKSRKWGLITFTIGVTLIMFFFCGRKKFITLKFYISCHFQPLFSANGQSITFYVIFTKYVFWSQFRKRDAKRFNILNLTILAPHILFH